MASLKKCIEAKCKDCTYDPLDKGTWRDQTERCNIQSCPLWPVRPMTTATVNLHRKSRTAEGEVDMDAILADLEDEEDESTTAKA